MGLCLSVFNYLTIYLLRTLESDVSLFRIRPPSAPNIECELPRGRKAEGLRNRGEEFDTCSDSWRTDTMGVRGGPQGSNLFSQAGRLIPSRKEGLRID